MSRHNEGNLELIKDMPCMICMKHGPSDVDHWRTRGAGGKNDLQNLSPLCRLHHREKHDQGIITFWNKYKMAIKINRMDLGLPDLDLWFLNKL